jgi:Zn-dependent protease with chaperone function
MSGLLPLIFALAILDTSRPEHADAPLGWWWWVVTFAASFAGWLSLGELVAEALAKAKDREWLERWDWIANGIMLLWLAWICYGLGWTGRVEIYTAAILPWLVMLVIHWWTMASALRPQDNRPWARRGLVVQQMRFGVPPILVVLPVFDVCNWISLRTGVQGWFMAHVGQNITIAIGSLLLGVGALVLLPAAMVRMWNAQALPQGLPVGRVEAGMRALLLEACARMRVGVRDIMLWPADGSRVYNAAVIGVLPRMRYVLFTEDLLADFPPPQVVAVLGHELGHARHRHLPLYLIFALATMLAAFLLATPVTRLLAHLPLSARFGPDMQKGVATLALLAIKWRLIFGYLSRACERQADLAGAGLCGDPAVMEEALRAVARLSGQPEDAPSWRHYTIAERVAFLERVRLDPSVAARHHRRVRIWWCALTVIVLALAGVLAIIALRGN